MRTQQLHRRLWRLMAGIPVSAMRDPRCLTPDQRQAVRFAQEELADLPICIDDTHELTVTDFRSRAVLAAKRWKADLMIVDYAQLLLVPARGTSSTQLPNKRKPCATLPATIAAWLRLPRFAAPLRWISIAIRTWKIFSAPAHLSRPRKSFSCFTVAGRKAVHGRRLLFSWQDARITGFTLVRDQRSKMGRVQGPIRRSERSSLFAQLASRKGLKCAH